MSLISINPAKLIEEYYELKNICSNLSYKEDCVRDTAGRIKGEFNEGNRRALLETADVMEKEEEELIKLMQALDTACQFYSKCEDNILNNSDSSAARYNALPAKRVDLQGVQSVISPLINEDQESDIR